MTNPQWVKAIEARLKVVETKTEAFGELVRTLSLGFQENHQAQEEVLNRIERKLDETKIRTEVLVERLENAKVPEDKEPSA